MVKHLSVLALVIVAVAASTVVLAADNVPDLVGRWIGTNTMHHKQLGFTTNKLEYVVEEQQGRVLKGNKTLTMLHDKSKRKEVFAGVIRKDNGTPTFKT